MITRRRIRAAARILVLTRGNITGLAARPGAVVVPTRPPIRISGRRSTTVAVAVATTWRGGSGSKGEFGRQIDRLADIRVHPPVREQAHVAADMLTHLRKSTRVGFWTSAAAGGITDVDHARCWCGNRNGRRGHVIGSHLFGWRFGIGVVVGRDDSRYDRKVESAFIVCVIVEEDAVVVDVAVVR